jgi:hypothetical protein
LPIRDLDSLRMQMARTLAITPREPDPLDQVRWQDLLEVIQGWYGILDRVLNEMASDPPQPTR